MTCPLLLLLMLPFPAGDSPQPPAFISVQASPGKLAFQSLPDLSLFLFLLQHPHILREEAAVSPEHLCSEGSLHVPLSLSWLRGPQACPQRLCPLQWPSAAASSPGEGLWGREAEEPTGGQRRLSKLHLHLSLF